MPVRSAPVLLISLLFTGCGGGSSGPDHTAQASEQEPAPATDSVCDDGQLSVVLEGLQEVDATDYRSAVVSAIAKDKPLYSDACRDVAPGSVMPDDIMAVRLLSAEPNASGEGFTVAVELCCLEVDDVEESKESPAAEVDPWGFTASDDEFVTPGEADCGQQTARAWALSLHYPSASTADEAAESAVSRLDSAAYSRACAWAGPGGERGKALAVEVVSSRPAGSASGYIVDVELCCETHESSPRTVAAQLAAAKEETDAFDAARRGNLEELIAHLADDPGVIARKADDGSTLLHRASKYQQACLLVLRGADVDARDAHGGSPLHYVAFTGDIDTAALLLAEGADIDAQDAVNATPLFRATRPEMAAWLLDRGADIEARDMAGTTPLHLAVVRGRHELVRVLLQRGADASVADSRGQSALDLAKDPEMLSMLRD